MKHIGLLFVLVMTGVIASGQSIKGTLMDPVEGTTVSGATVELENAADSTVKASVASDKEGKFSFTNLSLGAYILKATSIGFETLESNVTLSDTLRDADLGEIYIPKKTTTLEGVVIVATAPAVTQKGDTTQFSASQYKVNPDANVEDLIKKMPGITVDRSGNVTAQGEAVKKVTVDGKDFFGDDATMALRNLPSEVVDKIQVFDRLSDQAQLTGFDDGNSQKSINIVTKSGIRNGQFGRIYAGYGTDSRYSAGGNTSFFNGSRRISLVGNFNNINQQNFASQDLLGISSGGGRGGRGGGGGGGYRGGGNAGDFMVGLTPGISKTNAFGVNYGDKWGKKIDVTASYFFNNQYSTNESESNTEYLTNSRFVYNKGFNTSNNNNHRFNMRMEYKIDSNNTIYFIPSLSFQNNNSASQSETRTYLLPDGGEVDSLNNANGNSSSNRNGFNINNNLMYRHSFGKPGRTFSIGLQTSHSKNDGDSYNYNMLNYYDAGIRTDSLVNQFRDNNTKGSQYRARTSYTEPVGQQGMFQFEYSYQIQKNRADQETFDYDGNAYNDFNQLQSNKFDNTIKTHTGEVDYRLGKSRDNQFSVGVDFENTLLQSVRVYPTTSTVNQTFNTILPNLRWMKKIGRYSNVRLFYRMRNDFPSINQLQDVVDASNALSISSGNPELKQTTTNWGSLRYSYTNTRNSQSLFFNLFGQLSNNYITTATYFPTQDSVINGVEIKQGAQFSKPVNMNGYKNLNAFITYSFPIKPIKSNLNINTGYTFLQSPGMIDYKSTQTTNQGISAGMVLGSNISEYVDFSLSYNAQFNNTTGTDQRTGNNRYVTQTGGFFANLLSKNGWFVQNDLTYQNYSGLTADMNQSFWLWNAAIGKKFLKNKAGELKLSVFDLLNQNQSISRAVNANYITDSRNMVLQQYFMLTFTYSLRNFGKGKAPAREEGGEHRREWRGGPPGMMQGGGRPGGPMF
ncbi:outer membrane beta-barrel family protein [Niabella beijingensis]|uniref:outer membrane beta-barrel family protein n=1 Tax=Niabella beijingensis TaxID=2872700 RepID=UPI001CBECF3F|nr:outer membrane beta-barrel family protein [Niabella beijingensis]